MSEYIKSLRQHLGHTPLLQVGASVIVINEAGQMLMQREQTAEAGDMQAARWSLVSLLSKQPKESF